MREKEASSMEVDEPTTIKPRTFPADLEEDWSYGEPQGDKAKQRWLSLAVEKKKPQSPRKRTPSQKRKGKSFNTSSPSIEVLQNPKNKGSLSYHM